MRSTRSLSITLPVEMAEKLEAKVASGEFASESEVVLEGLETLFADDADIERWLAEEVGPTIDAMRAHPERAISAEEVDRGLDDLMETLLRTQARR